MRLEWLEFLFSAFPFTGDGVLRFRTGSSPGWVLDCYELLWTTVCREEPQKRHSHSNSGQLGKYASSEKDSAWIVSSSGAQNPLDLDSLCGLAHCFGRLAHCFGRLAKAIASASAAPVIFLYECVSCIKVSVHTAAKQQNLAGFHSVSWT